MNIEGTYTFQSRLIEIRRRLTKQDVLQHAIPGLEQLEPIEKNRYSVAIHIKYPPLAGTYQGQVSIIEDQQPTSYRFFIESNNGPNTITGIGAIQLHEQGDNTTVTYKGTLTLNKRDTRLTPAVTRGAIKLLIQQFFTSLSDQLRIDHTDNAQDNISVKRVEPSPELIDQDAPTSLAFKIVHILGLGRNSALEEAIWVERIRRTSLIAGFLLLVWIGTRLPRKK